MEELADVIASRVALDYLRETRDLEGAHELVAGEASKIIENLADASYYLDKALKGIDRHKSNREVEEMVRRCVEKISQILDCFPKLRPKLEE